MATSKEYLRFVLDQLSLVDGVTARPMMGEYVLYLHGRVFGGIYDNRMLIKPVPAAVALFPNAVMESPYPGAKPMILVQEIDNRELLRTLLSEMEPQLPVPHLKTKQP